MKISQIIFTTGNNMYAETAFVYYEDGSFKPYSRKVGEKMVLELANQKGFKTMTQLKNSGLIKFNTIENALNTKYLYDEQEKIQKKYRNNNSSNKKRKRARRVQEENNNKKKKKKESKTKQTWKKIVKGIGMLAIAATLATATKSGIQSVMNFFLPGTSKEQNDDEQNKKNGANIESENKVASLLNKKELLTEKKEFIESGWNYLYHYNGDFAKSYKDKSDNSRLALRWDEVFAQKLVYNQYNKYELRKIFDTYEFDANIFYDAYNEGIKQETQAHIIQTAPLDKHKILNSKKAQEFYSKYEELNISFNKQKSDQRKIEIAKKFFNQVKEDFVFKSSEYTTIESYKLSVIPIINAMSKMCKKLDKEIILSQDELNYLNYNLPNKTAKEKLEQYAAYLKNSDVVENNGLSFEEIENVAMEQMESEGIYCVSDDNRDISNYKLYRKNTTWNPKDKTTTEKDEKRNDKNRSSDKENEKNSHSASAEEITKEHNKSKDQTEEKKSSAKREDKKKSTNKESNKPSGEKSQEQTTSTPPTETPEADKTTLPGYDDTDIGREEEEENNEEEIINEEPIEEDQDQNSDKDIDVPTSSVDYPQQTKKPESNTPTEDSITDITKDPTGTVDSNEPLPNPNSLDKTNEEIVDQIIYTMEHAPEEDIPKVYML